MNDKIPVHPHYNEMLPRWTYYRDHYDGEEDYAWKPNPIQAPATSFDAGRLGHSGARRYLWQYQSESNPAFQLRLARAAFVNILAPVVDFYAAAVGKQGVVSIEMPKEIEVLRTDADLEQQSLLEFWEQARTSAAIYGLTFVVVDATRPANPEAELRSEADVEREGVRPFFRIVEPVDVLNWKLDGASRIVEILYRVPKPDGGSILGGGGTGQGASGKGDEDGYQYRYWNQEEWRLLTWQDGEMQTVESKRHNCGQVPVVPLYHKRRGPLRGRSLLVNAAKFCQLLTNWLSGLDNTMYQQMFAIPVLHSKNKPSAVGVGESWILHLNPGDSAVGEGRESFGFATPDTAPFEACWTSFFRVLQMANKQMGLGNASAILDSQPNQQSGVAKQWDFREAEEVMRRMALNEQEAVTRALYLASLWRGVKDPQVSAQYATSFDVATLRQDLEDVVAMQTAGIPDSALQAMKRRIIKKALPTIDEKEMQAILVDLETQLIDTDVPDDPDEDGN